MSNGSTDKAVSGETAREGSLDAPTRHPLAWREESFYDFHAIEEEMERVFDICHGCRRCFNLCDSFPILFDLVDEGPTGEMDGVAKADYKQVVDACTLCDMCFMTKCPYVPPHEFNLDFPHLMLRYRAAELRAGQGNEAAKQLTKIDRNAALAGLIAPLANWAASAENQFTRGLMEKFAGVDRTAPLPSFHGETLVERAKIEWPIAAEGTAFGKRKAAVFATCYANYHQPSTGEAALAVLAKLGVETHLVYPTCCGMPQLERGDIQDVARRAEIIADAFAPYIEAGHDVVALTASCGLMMKFEWPLILPENEAVRRLSAATYDISEYVVEIAKGEGIPAGALQPIEGGVTVHHACHARAQNMGAKSAELLKLIPDTKVDLVERCSGHGGTFGVLSETRAHAFKVGKPAARQVAQKGNETLCSDCPLACKHLGQLLTAELKPDQKTPVQAHPIEIFARALGVVA
jgi:glycerol-3-phosphate dehydrogenase subunit C